MATEGPNNPTAAVNNTGVAGVAWSNPTNVYSSDDSRATSAVAGSPDGNRRTQWLDVTDFDFAIPSDATIDGYTVVIEKSVTSTSGTPVDLAIELIGLTGTSSNLASGSTWPTTDADSTYGGATEKWGFATPSPTETNASTFGVRIRGGVSSGEGISTTFRVDWVRVTVHYTEAGGGGGFQAAWARGSNVLISPAM